ncbi:DUF2799 domain-containing protein [Oceanospirillum sediminis]|uniref:DUF2799 domain-containing protein n=1 Tax=Oceanospirillum sediminis TaxID=2760088 RepID=A0A839IS79_9GAMM|nr:DUF2799 domain-containing protein [Oceanospirillum sediminis]MBB1488185.1 DUF2799 domain-containing protein [Oceanospirillum sediminis]
MKKIKLLAVAASLLLLAGCSAMNKEECLSADWRLIGLQDGERGERLSQVGEYRKQCSEYGVTPDQDRYATGREEGLKSYCTKQSGFVNGKRDDKYKGVCPAESHDEFMAGYKIGQEYYAVQSEISELETKIRDNDYEFKEGTGKIDRLSLKVQQSSGSAEEKQSLMSQVLELSKKNVTLNTENVFLREKLAVKKYQYKLLQEKYGYR